MSDIRTVGDLIAALAAYPPDTPVLAYGDHADRLSTLLTVDDYEFARVTADTTHKGATFRRGSYWNPEFLTDHEFPPEAFEVVTAVTIEG